jgi:transcriptional regulator with XRE-family HTH domain
MTQNVQNEIIKDGADFVDRIDDQLKRMKKRRQDLCDYVGLKPQSISNWKALNGLPSADRVLQISAFLQVAPEWLITGHLTWHGNGNSLPSMIYKRISDCYNDPTDSSRKPPLHEYLKDFVDEVTLLNWRDDRNLPDPYIVYQIAVYMSQSFVFIATGEAASSFNYPGINGEQMSVEEYNQLCKFKKNFKLNSSFDALIPSDKEIIMNLINRFLEK